MSEDLQKLIIQLDAQTAMMDRNLQKANRIVDQRLGNIDKRVAKSDSRFAQWGKNVTRTIELGVAFAVLSVGKSAIASADKIDVMRDRIKDATKDSGGFQQVWDGITTTAIKTGSELENNVELVQRLAIAGKDLGGTNDQFIRLNETVQKLGIIGGSSTSALAAGTTQLAQGLGSGILRAEEFNSIVENIPAVANQIAKELGKSTAELRKMVLAGQVTSKEVFDALLKSGEEVDKRFNEIPPRLERSWNSFLTTIKLGIAELNTEIGLTEGLASIFDRIAKSQAKINELRKQGVNVQEGSLEAWQIFLGLTDDYELQQKELNKQDERRRDIQELIAHWSGVDSDYARARVKAAQDELKALNDKTEALKEATKYTGGSGYRPAAGNRTPLPPKENPWEQVAKGDKTAGDKPEPPTKPMDAARKSIEEMTAASKIQQDQIYMTETAIAAANAKTEIYNSLMEQNVEITDEVRASVESMVDAYEKQLEATARSVQVYENQQRAIEKALAEQEAAEMAHFKKLDDMANQFAEDFGDIFVNSVANGRDPFKALVSSFKNALIKMAADALIVNPLKNLLSPRGGNVIGGFASFLGFADGGSPPVGRPSIVGERGPELFVPKQAGTIVPNHKMGGGGIQIINQTTGRIDSVQQQTMSDGRVRMIIREELPGGVAAQAAAQNSPFNKTFRANNSIARRF